MGLNQHIDARLTLIWRGSMTLAKISLFGRVELSADHRIRIAGGWRPGADRAFVPLCIQGRELGDY